jgi:hypothetical protein
MDNMQRFGEKGVIKKNAKPVYIIVALTDLNATNSLPISIRQDRSYVQNSY